jgi:hypothetical protein
VFAAGGDPIGNGIVASLARPGGNATGFSQSIDLAGKRIEFVREVVPDLRRLAIMFNVSAPSATREAAEVQATATTLGLNVDLLEIRSGADIEPAFVKLKQAQAQALYVIIDPLINTNRVRINTLALGAIAEQVDVWTGVPSAMGQALPQGGPGVRRSVPAPVGASPPSPCCGGTSALPAPSRRRIGFITHHVHALAGMIGFKPTRRKRNGSWNRRPQGHRVRIEPRARTWLRRSAGARRVHRLRQRSKP